MTPQHKLFIETIKFQHDRKKNLKRKYLNNENIQQKINIGQHVQPSTIITLTVRDRNNSNYNVLSN